MPAIMPAVVKAKPHKSTAKNIKYLVDLKKNNIKIESIVNNYE